MHDFSNLDIFIFTAVVVLAFIFLIFVTIKEFVYMSNNDFVSNKKNPEPNKNDS